MENKDKLFFGILFICLALITFLIYYMANEGGQCVKNPYLYGASKMKNVECSCQQYIEGSGCPANFDFNDTTFNPQITQCGGGGFVQIIKLNDLDITP